MSTDKEFMVMALLLHILPISKIVWAGLTGIMNAVIGTYVNTITSANASQIVVMAAKHQVTNVQTLNPIIMAQNLQAVNSTNLVTVRHAINCIVVTIYCHWVQVDVAFYGDCVIVSINCQVFRLRWLNHVLYIVIIWNLDYQLQWMVTKYLRLIF